VADRAPSLAEEARHLHACLFAAPIDAVVIARYEVAHASACPSAAKGVGHALACPGTLRSSVVAKVVSRRLDAEAVEFALRRRGQGQELTRKMQILCYLVEVRPEYFNEFVNTEPSRFRAWAVLANAALRSAWKWLKGEYLIRRHGLV
jgi:hypothetical protein